MSLSFEGKVVIVTGAGGALGRSYALLFASKGASVVVNDLGVGMSDEKKSNSAAQKVCDEINERFPGKAVPDYHSVTEGAAIVKTAVDAFGKVDILINNAGILRDTSFHKMTDKQWDIINEVHLKGAYSTTKACWSLFRKQKYGRVIMTASAAGIYGNFGQANYSAAKLGLVGFSNTLAKEGARSNIHCNVICPIAGSRLTETILPPDMVAALKPEFVAPLVAYLCHDSCEESGSVFELGAGWVSKLRWQRSQGFAFPLNKPFSADDVAQKFGKITSFDENATYPTSANDAFTPIMANLETIPSKM